MKTVIRSALLRNKGGDENEAWGFFKDAAHRFLGHTKDYLCKTIVLPMLDAYEAHGGMNFKVHFLHYHISCFLENLGASIEKRGEGLHHDISDIEKR